jgi:DNA-binding transcriptional regulator YhcF (GntR family)
VQRAYDELVRDGLIYAQRGKGLFVSDQGTTSAQNGALTMVRKLFEEGVRAGRAAGVSADQLREIFAASMDEPANRGATSHAQ